MKVLVTGATGFLGTNIAVEAQREGHDVLATGMHGSETKYLEELGVEFALADITDAKEVDDLVSGMDAVIHAAGDTSFWYRTVERQRKINIDGALNVARSCLRHGVQRLVHTSTGDVVGHDPTRRPISEKSGKFNFTNMDYAYGESKYEGQLQLQALAEREGLDVLYMLPGFMCGPYDFSMQLGSIFFALKDKSLPGAPPGGSSYCHVSDVAAAHVTALTRGRPGEDYLCSGWNLPTRNWFDLMADAIGAPRVKRTLSERAFVAYAYAAETWSRISRNAPDMNPGMARYLSKFQFQDCSKAIKELGYQISPIPKILGDAIDWYRKEGYEL